MRPGYLAALIAVTATFAFAQAQAASTNMSELTPEEVKAELARAQASIDDMEYSRAIDILAQVVESNPRVADAYNLLGYSYRKTKDYERAERNYERALRIEPEHRGALEYIGELYIETDRRDRAQEMLARLEKACPEGCDELEDLKAALAGNRTTSNW